MDDRRFERVAAVCGAAVGGLSLLYAVAYLVITPADQRGTDVTKFFQSYLAHPFGPRLADLCLLLSGVVSGAVVVALVGRLVREGGDAGAAAPGIPSRALSWAGVLAVVSGFATAAHGLGQLTGIDRLAHRFATADAAGRAAVVVAHSAPSAVDPSGLATFAAGGLVALVVGMALRRGQRRLGLLGMVLGVDMVVLFLANATGIGALVLISGGLASVVLGPLWWFSLARTLWRPGPAPAPAVAPATAVLPVSADSAAPALPDTHRLKA